MEEPYIKLFNPLPRPIYFYRVTEILSTMGLDPGKNDGFTHIEEFRGNNLLECKLRAEKYYWERLEGIAKHGTYFLPFAAYKDFIPGKNAMFSIWCSLIEYYSEDNYLEYETIGDPENQEEAREIEAIILNGYNEKLDSNYEDDE